MESIRQSHFRALTSAGVALATIEDVLAVHADCGTVALVEDRPRRHGVAIPVEGADPGPAHLQQLDALLVKAIDDPGCRLVLASVRPGATGTLAEDDVAHWRALRVRHEGRSLELLDWFVLTGARRRPLSLADAAGPPAAW